MKVSLCIVCKTILTKKDICCICDGTVELKDVISNKAVRKAAIKASNASDKRY